MAQVTIYGFPQSTYVRTVRMLCEEKGVSYDLDPLTPHSPEMLAQNPTGKVPAFDHGDLHLYESIAIARYVDAAFDGPALQPGDLGERALMDQWISEIGDTIYATMLRQIVLPNLGLAEASEAQLAASAAVMDAQMARLDAQLQKSTWLAGDALSLADLFLLPVIVYVANTPQGERAMASRAALQRWQDAMAHRDSFKATIPA